MERAAVNVQSFPAITTLPPNLYAPEHGRNVLVTLTLRRHGEKEDPNGLISENGRKAAIQKGSQSLPLDRPTIFLESASERVEETVDALEKGLRLMRIQSSPNEYPQIASLRKTVHELSPNTLVKGRRSKYFTSMGEAFTNVYRFPEGAQRTMWMQALERDFLQEWLGYDPEMAHDPDTASVDEVAEHMALFITRHLQHLPRRLASETMLHIEAVTHQYMMAAFVSRFVEEVDESDTVVQTGKQIMEELGNIEPLQAIQMGTVRDLAGHEKTYVSLDKTRRYRLKEDTLAAYAQRRVTKNREETLGAA